MWLFSVLIGHVQAGGPSAHGLRATVSLDGPDASIVDLVAIEAAPTLRAGPALHHLDLLDATGAVVQQIPLPDARRRSILLPDGTGAAIQHEPALLQVALPWPAGAVALRDTARIHALPRPQPVPATDPPAVAVPVLHSGPSTERLDLVILGDGYTAPQLPDFTRDVDDLIAYLLELQPYTAYQGLLNVWRIELVSADPGASHPEQGTAADTALSCSYGCGGLDRLICCDEATILEVAEAAVPSTDGILVLVNDDTYGGSGGFSYAAAYVGPEQGLQVAAHELGHTLFGLWDEYSYGIEGDEEGPNCSADPAGHWDEWHGTHGVEAFPTCSFDNLYRPTEAGCMMKTLREGYCPVCRQIAVLSMYDALPGLIASVEPPPGTPLTTAASTIAVQTHAPRELLTLEWSVDGERIALDEDQLDLSCSGLTGQLSLRAHDDVPWVRSEPIEEHHGPWPIHVPPCAPAPRPGCGCASGPPTAPGLLALIALGLHRTARRRPR